MFGIFAAPAELERELIIERIKMSLSSAYARGRNGPAKWGFTQAARGERETKGGELRRELGVTRQTLYRHVDPNSELRPDGEELFGRLARRPSPDAKPTQISA